MRVVFVAAVFLCLVSYVAGHAKLNVPLAWNPSPSKTAPCGGGTAFQTTISTDPNQDVLKTGTNWNFQWQLVAGDGNGLPQIGVDSNYGTNFLGIGTATYISGPAGSDSSVTVLGVYTMSIAIPSNLVCTGGVQGNLCSMQFKTPTGWYACATITTDKSVANNNSISTQQATCVQPTGQRLFFCTNNVGNFALNGANNGIWVVGNPTLQTATGFTDQDALANATFYLNMKSSLVFGNSKLPNGQFNPTCAQAYHRYLCAQMFPACSGSRQSGLSACKSACYAAVDACNLNPSHQSLFDCVDNTNYATASQPNPHDSVGTCAPCVGDCALTVTAGADKASISAVALLVAAVFAVLKL